MITFVEVGKAYNEYVNEEYLEVRLTQLEVSQDHTYDSSLMKINITDVESLDEVYKNVANTLLDYNKNEPNRYIFDTTVFYNKSDIEDKVLTEGYTQNKHAEKIRQEYRKLVGNKQDRTLVQRTQLHKEEAIDLHNKVLSVLPGGMSLETHYAYGVVNN